MTAPAKSDVRAEARRLLDAFLAAGAQEVETAILQPADELLDLYGEDIRARAFVAHDPIRGEMMLRPDFTVPVVRRHMEAGLDPARYAYAGEVFRMQDEEDPARPSEYIQVGFELLGGDDPAGADAEVFATLRAPLGGLPLRAAIGDVGLLLAAVDALPLSEARRAALRRHLWRPRRFRSLLDRFAAPPAPHPALATAGSDAPEIGLRARAEVEARLAALRADAAEPPLPRAELDGLEALLALSAPAPVALDRLARLALPGLDAAVAGFAARLDALRARGVAVGELAFEGSFGRTTLEYYDGFVFGLFAAGRPDLPPVATGGRYDALTRVLGRGRAVPAVGGVIRPGTVLRVRGRP